MLGVHPRLAKHVCYSMGIYLHGNTIGWQTIGIYERPDCNVCPPDLPMDSIHMQDVERLAAVSTINISRPWSLNISVLGVVG